MSRFADRLLARGFKPPYWSDSRFLEQLPDYRKHIRGKLQAAEIFCVDNVCQYFFEESDQDTWDILKDFPNLAPPFPSFFLEMRRPRHSPWYGKEQLQNDWLEGWGVLFEAWTIEQRIGGLRSPEQVARLRVTAEQAASRYGGSIVAKTAQYGNQVESYLTEAEKVALSAILEYRHAAGSWTPDLNLARFKWMVDVTLFAERQGGEIIGPLEVWQMTVDQAGKLTAAPNAIHTGKLSGSVEGAERAEPSPLNFGLLFCPALLALSFLHCKNVKVARQVPPAKLSRAFQRRHGHPLVRFHTLEITPMKKVLEQHTPGGVTGIKQALHICRGHFKTFTPDRRLFGRHTGTYWWESHVRGSVERGVSLKDYQVNQPATLPLNREMLASLPV